LLPSVIDLTFYKVDDEYEWIYAGSMKIAQIFVGIYMGIGKQTDVLSAEIFGCYL